MRKKITPRNGLFILLGILIFSFFFWITKGNYIQVYGMILIGLICNVLYKIDHKMIQKKEWINTIDIIHMCVGAVLSSLMEGFLFNFLLPSN